MIDVQNFLQKTQPEVEYQGGLEYQPGRPWIYCNDGEGVSIQASRTHYSFPRENDSELYFEIEAGYPSAIPPKSWITFAEDKTRKDKKRLVRFYWGMFANGFKYEMTVKNKLGRLQRALQSFFKSPLQMTVYGYMPVKIAQEYIDEHGGIDWKKTIKETA